MPELKTWRELPAGGATVPDAAGRARTGAWRTGLRPEVELYACINCLLCWLYCPDSAVRLERTTFKGFDFDYCKGCEICAEVCPVGAITMVEDDVA